jgi:serine/threonine protein kinase
MGRLQLVILGPPGTCCFCLQSPQLISSKSSKQGYDAQKADVWACGVLLFVMLLGMFPFEHSEHPDPNSSDAHVEVGWAGPRCWGPC